MFLLKSMTRPELLKLFASETSCHGIGKLISSKHIGLKVFWGIIVLSALVGLCGILKSIIECFMQWPTATSIKIHPQPALDFPSVLFCSSNLFNRHRLEKQNVSEHLADYTRLIYSATYEKYDPMSMNKTLSEMYDALVTRYGSIENFFLKFSYTCEEFFTEILFNADTFFNCSDKKVVRPILDMIYGKCFLISLPDTLKQIWPNLGLRATIKLGKKQEHIPNAFLPARGIIFRISQPFDPWSMSELWAAPAVATITTIQQETIAYSNNVLKRSCEMSRDYTSLDHCKLHCFNMVIVRECSCYIPANSVKG